jgi:hypothetical protein
MADYSKKPKLEDIRYNYDSEGNPVAAGAPTLRRVQQGYDKFVNEPILPTADEAYKKLKGLVQPSQQPEEQQFQLDPAEVARKAALGNALMDQKARQQRINQDVDASRQPQRDAEYLNNYNRMLGNDYNQGPVAPGKVSDEEAANLASEFTKQPPRFNKLRKSMGNR